MWMKGPHWAPGWEWLSTANSHHFIFPSSGIVFLSPALSLSSYQVAEVHLYVAFRGKYLGIELIPPQVAAWYSGKNLQDWGLEDLNSRPFL